MFAIPKELNFNRETVDGHILLPVRIFYYMNLLDLHPGQRAVVVHVDCSPALKERLRSLNVRAGSVVKLMKVSLFQKTFLIQASNSQIALRREVAASIHVRIV